MHWLDLTIFIVYLSAMVWVGYYFLMRNRTSSDYYVGGRKMGKWHIGLSVVATDVGGGFSIGLGGLGFVMGLSGSWLLFTGLVGAWLSAVFLIPEVSRLSRKYQFLSFPQFLEYLYDRRVAYVAGIISALGYIGFTSSQILAGAKLASATFNGLNLQTALLIMGIIAVGYTVLGGLKAVIYTDTIQWIILLSGLILIAIPLSYTRIGGMEVLHEILDRDLLKLNNISWQKLVNWFVTILPIWFIGMTLYQRIYAARDASTARKAWFIAGLFEYPVMAFTGVLLGLFARVALDTGILAQGGILPGDSLDPEMGLPLLLKIILPVGLTGLVLSAYFSAIMSTADSCLIAASGNLLTDVLGWHRSKNSIRKSQVITLLLGIFALLMALKMPSVLDLMLYSYAFMVSGLIIPVLAGLFFRVNHPAAAFWSMLAGGTTTLVLIVSRVSLPLELDANVFGIGFSAFVFLLVSRVLPRKVRAV